MNESPFEQMLEFAQFLLVIPMPYLILSFCVGYIVMKLLSACDKLNLYVEHL